MKNGKLRIVTSQNEDTAITTLNIQFQFIMLSDI
jgi:hypothetical protein